MSECRFCHEEGDMADYIAKILPDVNAIKRMGEFYGDVMRWCMKNYDLVQWISNVDGQDDKDYCKLLEYLHEIKNVEAFGIVLAMRLKEFRGQ